MEICVILLSSLWLVSVAASVPFTLTDCSSSSNQVINVRGHTVDYPVQIPGHVKVQANMSLLRDVEPNRYILDVTVEKWFWIEYFTLHVNSYDACELLDTFENRGGCPWQLRDSNFPCMCPFTNGTYTLDPLPFYIPEVQGVWQWIAYGDFRVSGTLYDKVLSETVNCYRVEFTIQSSVKNSWAWW